MAKRASSINPFHLLIEAWTFLRKQPALFSVFFWFLALPVVALDVMDAYWPENDVPSIRQIGDVGYVLATLLISVVTFWGLASILLVGRRMVVNRAGRSRTSFRSVRRESVRLILPLFFTSLLRSITTLEWSLLGIIPAALFLLGSQGCRATLSPILSATGTFFSLGTVDPFSALLPPFLSRCGLGILALPLLIPALIYQIRTVFFGVIIASENLRYRDALRHSRATMRGRTWSALGVLAVLVVVLFVPAFLLSFVLGVAQDTFATGLPVLSAAADDVLFAFAGMLLTLSLIAFYGTLRKQKKNGPTEVVPEEI